MTPYQNTGTFGDTYPLTEEHYRELRRKTTISLLILYLSPLILLAVYFLLQYETLVSESQRLHLKAIAESQANTLDLFLSERLNNLSNLIDKPDYHLIEPPSMETDLQELKKISDTFVDIGYFDSSGVQVAYAGPYPSLEQRNYRSEAWYKTLREGHANYVITDIYLGFRQQPHFTIAVKRRHNGRFIILRSTLDPGRIYEYISSLKGAQEVVTSLINREGQYQLVTPPLGAPLDSAPFLPEHSEGQGVDTYHSRGKSYTYAYAWLQAADWALVVQESPQEGRPYLSGPRLRILGIATLMIVIGFSITMFRARKRVKLEWESETTRVQLGHAAKLASVGELAAGIAHEINNPLASINEEAGLMKDLMNPELGTPARPEELVHHLDSIQESVFRCRDITRKLLGFVRKSDMLLKPHDIHRLIDEVVDGLLGHEMLVSNIEIVRMYDDSLPELITDGNQLEQVILNILNNAVDAMENKPGVITITTENLDDTVRIGITDTGKGMTSDQMEKIFVPFYTTKEVGRGTGLGLSVSYGIIKNLGGTIDVTSTPGIGSTFTIELPLQQQKKGT